MNLIEKINAICEEAKNQFHPDLKTYGKNFRAISDSALLEVLNPLFNEHNIGYDVIVKEHSLTPIIYAAGTDNSGNMIERYVFLAEAVVQLRIKSIDFENNEEQELIFEGWGSGLDVGDKATGKAITAAVKYALFKGFRLQYSNDPDADASEEIEAVKKAKNEKSGTKNTDISKNESKRDSKTEELATDKMKNYIVGLVKDVKMTDETFSKTYGISFYDEKMTMRKAREIIDDLKAKKDELPF